MSFLFSALNAATSAASAAASAKTPSSGETVARLVDRATHATLLEDRRAAVQGLRGMARDYTHDVGVAAIPVLVHILKADRMDVEIIKAALDCLNIVCSRSDPDANVTANSGPAKLHNSNDLGRMFTEVYTKDPSNVTVLLEILEEFEFYIRFNTIQFLMTLLENYSERLQECVLTSPIGIARLMDLLDDPREIIRNEALLLLIALTSNNTEIQKIIAFENAFERLLGIVLAEGASEGDIVVQDCLTLTLNLLRYNVSNQNLFRESSCIQKIPSLLLSHSVIEDASGPVPVTLTHEANTWSDQKIVNAELILELIRILVVPNSTNTVGNQKIMNQAGILPPIIDLALCERVPARVRVQALNAVGDVIRGSNMNQEVLGKSVVVPPKKEKGIHQIPTSAILYLVQIALQSEVFNLRAAAAYCFQSFVYNNPDNQLALAATLTPPPMDTTDSGAEQPQSPGSLLISSVLNWQSARADPYRAWFATVLLAHIVSENTRCQELALSVRIDSGVANTGGGGGGGGDDDEPVSLLHKVIYALLVATRDGGDLRIIVGMLELIAVWLFACVKAVKEFLSEGSNLQFLIEQVNASSGVDPLVQGISAFIIAICHEYNDNSESAFTQASLQSLIVSRIGADIFASRVDRLKESKFFQKAALYFTVEDSRALPEVYFDVGFVELLKSSCEPMIKAVINPKVKEAVSKKAAEYAELQHLVDSYKLQIAQQEYELSESRNLLAQTESFHQEEVSKLQAEVQSLRAALATTKALTNDQLPPRPRTPTATSSSSSADPHVAALQRQMHALQVDMQLKTQQYDMLVQEQEDLLVCLAESDITIRDLKARLRALGQVVESDDDDDEEDGGDDENGGGTGDGTGKDRTVNA
ncbi:hypothetical protein HDU84_009320 [Entophlyctis sp. JEL0112]|nr:hypothetical protein HDU84_009320 [Entophlyctis sp. JEL0112]